MKWLLLSMIALAGMFNTVQTGINMTLHKSIDSPGWAMAAVFGVGLLTSCIVAVVSGQRFPGASVLTDAPWWAWIGGVLGAFYILTMMLASGKVGAAVFMGIAVTTAVITSLMLDHFGWMGFDVHRAGVGRIVGGALMIGGLALIARF